MRNRREVERERGYEQLRGTFASVFAAAAAEGITGARDPSGVDRAARAAGDHRASDRGEARHRARAASAHLSAPARSRIAALDRARTPGSDPRRSAMKSSCSGSPASSSWRSRPSRRRSPGGCISSTRICSTWCRSCSQRSRARSPSNFRTRRSKSRCSFSSAPGSAAIATAIPTSPAKSRGARCGRRAWRACSAIGPGCWTWCEISASRITRWRCRTRSATRWPRRFARHPTARCVEARNRGEIFRQFLGCMLARIDVTIAHAEREQPAPEDSRLSQRRPADRGHRSDAPCARRGAARSASPMRCCLPLRREVGMFRFSTVRLDVRENSMRINQTLAAMFRLRARGARAAAARFGGLEAVAASRTRRAAQRSRRATKDCRRRRRKRSRPSAPSPGMRAEIDREAFGALILSMTRSAADILGVYLLAKEGGLFADTAAVERCTLPIVPLLETIPDLRRAAGHPEGAVGRAPGAAQPATCRARSRR